MTTSKIASAVSLFALLSLNACVNQVIDASGGGGGAAPVEPTEPVAQGDGIAITYAQLEAAWAAQDDIGGTTVTTTGGGAGIDPDTLYITVTNSPLTCGDPTAWAGCGNNWEVSVALPPDLQEPGVLDLSDTRLNGFYSISGPGTDECWGGGGSFIDGTIEIISIDDTEVVGRFVDTSTFDFDANGEFTVVRCP